MAQITRRLSQMPLPRFPGLLDGTSPAAKGYQNYSADTDATIKTYQSRFHLFSTHAFALESANRGIRYLAIALDDAKTTCTWDDMKDYSDVAPLVEHGCAGEQLVFSGVREGLERRATYQHSSWDEQRRSGKGITKSPLWRAAELEENKIWKTTCM